MSEPRVDGSPAAAPETARGDTLDTDRLTTTVLETQVTGLPGNHRITVHGSVEAVLAEDTTFGSQDVEIRGTEHVLRPDADWARLILNFAPDETGNEATWAGFFWYRRVPAAGDQTQAGAAEIPWRRLTVGADTLLTHAALRRDSREGKQGLWLTVGFGAGGEDIILQHLDSTEGEQGVEWEFRVFPVPYEDAWDIQGPYNYQLLARSM